MEEKKNLVEVLLDEKKISYNLGHNFNIDHELMIEITLDEYRDLVSKCARLTAELKFLKGSGNHEEVPQCSGCNGNPFV